MVGADFSNSYMFLKLENVLKFYSTRDQILVFELKDTNHCVTITMSHLCLFFFAPTNSFFVLFALPGTLSVVLKITPPCFDKFCEPMGYRVMVNDEIYANLPLDTKKYCMKVQFGYRL